MAELLVWPALVAYGEAAVASVAEARRPGLAGRLAVWGVRLGWLAQTALLLAQATQADAFPWSTWAGALNLLSWLVVSGYLVWGCRASFRLLGLAVTPVAALLLAVAWAGGGTGAEGDHPGTLLALHVAVILAGLAGFVLAAALGALYLWQERRLKRREPMLLRLRIPPLETLDALAARTLLASLGALTVGIAAGFASLAGGDGSFDAAMGVTLAAWAVYGAYALLRLRGLHGRRAAAYAVAALGAVLVVFPLAHFAG
ncbi:MAG TPA: cytochrome c biogenesis protein CcsA [Gaiellaceae bacterium]|nr:cytochrome c biogenesis protein CcsA [Gaiellaceae bacterium]